MKSPWDIFGSIVLVMLAAVLSWAIYGKMQHDQPKAAPNVEPARPQFVVVGSKRCPACDKLAHTLADPRVQERLKGYAVVKTSGLESAKRYFVAAYPTYLILTPEGRELRRGVGYRNVEDFLAWLDQARPNTTADFTPVEDAP